MKNNREILDKLFEIIEMLDVEPGEKPLSYFGKKTKKTKKTNIIYPTDDTTVVYKLNVETEMMVAVGQVDFHIGEEDYVVNLFNNPEKQFLSIPNIKDAKAYYPNWFIQDGKGGFIEIYPINKVTEIYIPSEFDDFPIGVISDRLSVTLYSSYEKMSRNKYD